MNRLLSTIAIGGACLSLGACQTAKPALVHENCALDETGVLVGTVDPARGVSGPFVVVALDQVTGKVVQRAFLEDPRAFAMLMNAGSYKFYAFADRDRDGIHSPDEPVSALYLLRSPLRAGDMLEMPVIEVRAPPLPDTTRSAALW